MYYFTTNWVAYLDFAQRYSESEKTAWNFLMPFKLIKLKYKLYNYIGHLSYTVFYAQTKDHLIHKYPSMFGNYTFLDGIQFLPSSHSPQWSFNIFRKVDYDKLNENIPYRPASMLCSGK